MKPDTSAIECWKKKVEAAMELYRLQIDIYLEKIKSYERQIKKEIQEREDSQK